MADKRPLANGGLFITPAEMYGGYDEEPDDTLIVKGRGSNQFLGREANHHDGTTNVTAGTNRVQAGQLPRTSSAPSGAPTHAQPLGTERSLNG